MRRVAPLFLLAGLALAERAGYLKAQFADGEHGVRIARVFPGSPAAKAGLQAGDVIVRLGDAEIATVVALATAFAWLRKRFPKHPLFLAGHSCGAHLGALLGMDPRYLKRHELGLDEVRGVIAIGGGFDLVKYHAILAHGIGGRPGLGQEKADAHLKWIFG